MSKLISTIFNHFDFNSEKLIVIDSKNNGLGQICSIGQNIIAI